MDGDFEKAGVERPNPDEVQTLAASLRVLLGGLDLQGRVQDAVDAPRRAVGAEAFSINELIGPLAKEEPVYATIEQEIQDWHLKSQPRRRR